MPRQSLHRLEPVPRNAKHHLLIVRNLSGLHQFPSTRYRDPTRRLGKDSLRLRQKLDSFNNLLIRRILCPSTRPAHRFHSIIPIRRGADGQGLCNRLRMWHRSNQIRSPLPRRRNRVAPRRLRPMNGKGGLTHQPQLGKLFVRFINFRQQRTTRHAHHGVAWNSPPQLLHDLVSESLRPLRIVRPQIHIHKTPTILSRNFGAETIHRVISSLNSHHIRSVNNTVQHFVLLQVRRNQHPAF